MSMPTFPEHGIDITQDQAFNMLLGSIAMEELALSHIINSEGEKLQYVLGTLPSMKPACAPTPCELLKINQSITALLENVSHNQLLLKSKLQQVLDAKEKWSPSPECQQDKCCPHRTTWVFHQAESGPWHENCPLYWKQVYGPESSCRLKCSAHSMFHLDKKSVYLVSYSFHFKTDSDDCISVALQSVNGEHCKNLSVERSGSCEHGKSVSLSGSTVLSPASGCPTPSPIRFVLLSPECVTLECAALSLTILS